MDKHYIQELILKDHYGLLTPEEQDEFEILVEHYDEVKKMREELRSEVPVEEARNAITEFDPDQSYRHIIAIRRARQIIRKRRLRQFAAALLLLLIGSAYILVTPARRAPAPFVAAPPHAVSLKLAGGQTLNLGDSSRREISLGNAVLNHHNRQLSFKTGNGGGVKGWNTLTVPPDQDFKVELADGTTVHLNSNSTLRFPFSFDSKAREVFIEGEAYFKVARDAHRPFIVHSGVTVIKVLGTEFNINGYLPGRIITSLVNGKVTVHADGEQVTLHPGSEAITRTGTPIKVQPNGPEALLWRDVAYYSEKSTVAEIAALVARRFNVKMMIDNPAAKNKTFRVKLCRDQDLESFIQCLNETTVVTLRWEDGILHCQ
ncbi:FecR family protein [Chitinophaga lutea]|uniref:FecR family protein n=1 Tax=Chitinophaga lutea TaxID=2488634 RepID=A0A3N4Q1W3_9BACT|nr:FecR family protein [Chitinophaga lutea]RPE14238.1 FecR family protein [Chitinophaga lutea]